MLALSSMLRCLLAQNEVDPTGGTLTLIRVLAGLGVGVLAAAAFLWLLVKQSEKHVEEKKVMRKEHHKDMARLERWMNVLFQHFGITPPPEEKEDKDV